MASNPVASASGVTTKVIAGIAMALASGELADACWKRKASTGSMARVISHCRRAAATNRSRSRVPLVVPFGIRVALAPAPSNTATAPNDSQNPVAIGAQGSATITSAAAAQTMRVGASGVRSPMPKAATASIRKVRRAGTPHPARRQYPQATATAIIAPIILAGSHSHAG